MADNLRHAQYGADGVQIDDPQVKFPSQLVDSLGKSKSKGVGQANSLIIFGDSLIEQSNTSTSSTTATFSRGFVTWMNIFLGYKQFTIQANLGIGGQTTSDMLLRVDAVNDYSADYCLIMGGINDIAGSLQSAETVCANLTKLYNTIQSFGKKLIVCTIMPVTATHPLFSLPLISRIIQVNNFIRQYVAANSGVFLVDAAAAVADPTSSNNSPIASYFADTVHLSPSGAFKVGKEAAASLSSLLPSIYTGPSSIGESYLAARRTLTTLSGNGAFATATLANHGFKPGDQITVEGASIAGFNLTTTVLTIPTGNTFTYACNAAGNPTGTIYCSNNQQLIDNPLFGNPSGGLAANWTIVETSTTTVPTNAARVNGRGNNQQLAISSSGAGNSLLRGGDYLTRAYEGDVVQFECYVEVDAGASNLEMIQLNLSIVAGGVTYIPIASYRQSGVNLISEAYEGLMRTVPFRIPGAVTRLRPEIVTYFSAAGSATIRVSQARLQKVRPY